MADTPIQKATVGRIVHFVPMDGPHLAAIITSVVPDVGVTLTIFEEGCETHIAGVLHDAEFGEETWHWPERD